MTKQQPGRAEGLRGQNARLDGPYDYFGKPAGWAPMLSFQANLSLFEREIATAIRVMFLAHWVTTKENRERKSAESLTKACDQLRAESEKALADYNVAQGKLQDMEDRAKRLAPKAREYESLGQA